MNEGVGQYWVWVWVWVCFTRFRVRAWVCFTRFRVRCGAPVCSLWGAPVRSLWRAPSAPYSRVHMHTHTHPEYTHTHRRAPGGLQQGGPCELRVSEGVCV